MPLPTVFDEIDRLFDELIRRPWGGTRQIVPAEMRAVADGWIVRVPVEGLSAGEVQVQVQGRELTIGGHRRHEGERRGASGWTRTRQEVALHRTLLLPGDADPETVEVHVEDSTLTIHIRKRRL